MATDRRAFLQMMGAAGAAALAGPRALAAAARRRPNIILIMADDMGFSDIAPYGSEIATPNLERLARGGVRFTHFYNTARCCPTRSSLMTGLYPHQAGVGHMVADRGTPAYQGYLNDRCVTIAEALRPAGYHTTMSGKWHVGEQRPHWPTDRGFERYFGLISGAANYWKPEPERQMALGDQPFRPDPDKPFYMTDAFTEYALKWLSSEAGNSPSSSISLTLPRTGRCTPGRRTSPNTGANT
jgi:arylsulfatase